MKKSPFFFQVSFFFHKSHVSLLLLSLMSASDSGRQLILWKWRQVHWHLYCDCHGEGVGSMPEQKILGELSTAKTTYRYNNQIYLSITNQKMGTLLASSRKNDVSLKPSHSYTFGYPIHSLIHFGERTPCFTERLSTNSNLHVDGFWFGDFPFFITILDLTEWNSLTTSQLKARWHGTTGVTDSHWGMEWG